MNAKVSVLKDIYKDYMSLIRAHVKSYAGEKKDANYQGAKLPTVKFTVPDELRSKINPNDLSEFDTAVKNASTTWKKFYGEYKGTKYYSLDGTLPNYNSSNGGKIAPENEKDIMDRLTKAFEERNEYKAYSEIFKRLFPDRDLPIDSYRKEVQYSEEEVGNKSSIAKQEKKDNG